MISSILRRLRTSHLLMRLALFVSVTGSLLMLSVSTHALGDEQYVSYKSQRNSVQLADDGQLATLYVDLQDYAGLRRAVSDLQADFQRVTGEQPDIAFEGKDLGKHAVIVGSLGNSALIDQLVSQNKLDTSDIAGEWEAFQIQVVDNPVAGVEKALVIVGSDMRGAIFGVYDLSQQIGVSPWYWWADVPTTQREELYVSAKTFKREQPKVQYRGIFLNDEAPALTGWVMENYGNYNSEFYVNVFELLLRLKANFLWPAMWNNSFSVDDPLNPKLADEYGIVMSTSHHEPMMRAHKEWKGPGPWDYSKNAEVLREFWRGGVERNSDYESIITLAMRGDGDHAMSEDANVELLEQVVKDQREIIADVFADKGKDVTEVPQVWALYKEVQEYYEKGMRVPDDVILLWTDDNWANIRRLPTAEERERSGGAGVYYHFDYVGGPRSYRWINVTPVAKTWEQMNLAYEYDANRIWVVNVGDLKPMEYPIEFFLEMAWNPEEWPRERVDDYGVLWAEREFGEKYAKEIAALVEGYVRHNGRRKPELMEATTYSLLHYNEAERIEAELDQMEVRARKIYAELPDAKKDAFYQLVLHPVAATATVTKMYIAQGRNQLYAAQGRPLANKYAEQVKELFAKDAALTERYHSINDGKWNHFMSQPHIGYVYWNNPENNIMPTVTYVEPTDGRDMGVAVEGMAAAWPHEGHRYALPRFTPYGEQERTLQVFNKGTQPLNFTVSASDDWIEVEEGSKEITTEEHLLNVSVNWKKLPEGESEGYVQIKGPSWVAARVAVSAFKPEKVPARKRIEAAVEADGYIAIEAANTSDTKAANGYQWQEIPLHGRTESSMGVYPVADFSFDLNDAPMLEYKVYLTEPGDVTVEGLFAPTWPIHPERGLRYAIAFDDQEPVIVDVLEGNDHAVWQESVRSGVRRATTEHSLDEAGYHTLKVWAIDPAVVVQKWLIDTGGLQPSYLGPEPR